jgi:ariadne-1
MSDYSDDEMVLDDEEGSYSEAEEDQEDYSEFDAPILTGPPKPFRCVCAADLHAMQATDVKRVADTLAFPPGEAAVLLRSFKWDCERLISAYFENSESVLATAGVCEPSKRPVYDAQAAEPFTCPICLESVTTYSALGCGHKACTPCFREYVERKIDDDGTASIHARCPSVKCNVQLTEPLVCALVSEQQHTRFALYLEQSYVDENARLEWCPAPQCTHAILAAHALERAPLSGAHRVTCDCGARFCFSCRRDDHSPATCTQLQTWLVKCKDDSETFNWLQANTRTCPVCKTAIEKNGGCNHMSCKKCQHEWCWVCAGPWKDHSGQRARGAAERRAERARGDDSSRRCVRTASASTPRRCPPRPADPRAACLLSQATSTRATSSRSRRTTRPSARTRARRRLSATCTTTRATSTTTRRSSSSRTRARRWRPRSTRCSSSATTRGSTSSMSKT